ncbi:MAG: c-type cytochrome [Roseinatronobacter sp.]
MLKPLCLAALLAGAVPVLAQDMTGHGGPVGALDVAGPQLLSGSFDTRAILWDIDTAAARNVTRFHEGNVTAVAFLPDGGFVTAGQDGRIARWQADARAPDLATEPGVSAVASLAVSPDGGQVAVGSWDGQVRVLDLASGTVQSHQAHSERVTGLGYLASGDLVSVGGDARLVRWDAEFTPRARADLPDLPNGLVISGARIAVIFAEGALRLFSDMGEMLPERFLTDRPLVALAASGDAVVAGAIDGTVWALAPETLTQQMSFQAGNGPVWALALSDGEIFTAGADGVIRRWSLADGTALGGGEARDLAEYTDDSRGAEIWRACAVCHSLIPDDHSRAGPSLHGIFGQRIATQPGYDFSPALQDLDIVWTPRTVAELFEHGPEAYTPGSRMPEQRIASPEDRAALVEFLARAAQQPVSPR